MIKKLLTRVIYTSAKAGVKESAAYFAEFLRATKQELHNLHPGKTFEDSLSEEGETIESFDGVWVKSAIEGYIEKYPPKTELQKEFYLTEIRPYLIGLAITRMSPSMIPNVILKYGYSEFFDLCTTLCSQGQAVGKEYIANLEQIINAEFAARGNEDALLR